MWEFRRAAQAEAPRKMAENGPKWVRKRGLQGAGGGEDGDFEAAHQLYLRLGEVGEEVEGFDGERRSELA